MELILTGEFIDATTAEKWGLVSKVVPEDKLLEVRTRRIHSNQVHTTPHTHTHIQMRKSGCVYEIEEEFHHKTWILFIDSD
jgi:enoyl-CoA hydratase/carnithine racemase